MLKDTCPVVYWSRDDRIGDVLTPDFLREHIAVIISLRYTSQVFHGPISLELNNFLANVSPRFTVVLCEALIVNQLFIVTETIQQAKDAVRGFHEGITFIEQSKPATVPAGKGGDFKLDNQFMPYSAI